SLSWLSLAHFKSEENEAMWRVLLAATVLPLHAVKFGADLLAQAEHALACATGETGAGCDGARSAKLRNVLARTQPDERKGFLSLLSERKKNPSIAVVSVCYPDNVPYAQNPTGGNPPGPWQQVCNAARKNFEAYCNRHGYRLFFVDQAPAGGAGRPATWAKVLGIQQAFRAPGVEAVFTMDGDSLFMNFEKDLESLLPKGGKQLTISGDMNCFLNAGHMMFKKSEWMARFLDETWSIWPAPSPWDEQSAWIYQLSDLPAPQRAQCRQHSEPCCAGPVIEKADRRNQAEMNAFYEQFKPGDFIVHFVSRAAQEKANLMTEYGKRALGLVTMQQLLEFHTHLTS
ncbi:unnamed protein product, partial [Effrenium voratum]